MDGLKRTKTVIEALLMVSENGLSDNDIANAIEGVESKEIKKAVEILREEYDSTERAFNIAKVANRYRIVTRPEYMPWINNLYRKPVDRLTGPSLETLAIIAYKQPCTRAEIEEVRGVNAGGVVRTLLEKDLLKVKGRKDAPGRPLLYGTTEKFLEIFGLNSLNDLPELKEFDEEDLDFGKPREVVERDLGEEEGPQPSGAEKVPTPDQKENVDE